MTRLIKSGWRNRKWVGISILSLTALGLILWQLPAIVDGYISTRDLLIRSLAFSIFPPAAVGCSLGAGDMEETLTAGNTPLESLGGRSAGNARYMGSPGLLLGLYRRAGGVQPGRVDWPEHKGFLRRAGACSGWPALLSWSLYWPFPLAPASSPSGQPARPASRQRPLLPSS